MPIPVQTLKIYEMTRLDHAIMKFAKIETPAISDILAVKCMAQIEEGIDLYRACATEMSQADLKAEEHNSQNWLNIWQTQTILALHQLMRVIVMQLFQVRTNEPRNNEPLWPGA